MGRAVAVAAETPAIPSSAMRAIRILASAVASVLVGTLVSVSPAGAETGWTRCEFIPTPDNPAARPVSPPHPDARTRGTVEVTWVTNHGEITVQLDRRNAPCAVHNMAHLVAETFYDRSRCWRLTNSPRLGVLQCGDIWSAEVGGPGYRFNDELTGRESYPRGTIAMGNLGKDTNGSQFFIVHGQALIPPAYTVLGTVVDGMDVLDRIAEGGIIPDGAVDGQPRSPVEIRETYLR